MFEAIIKALIGLCFLVAGFFLVLWVLGELGIVIPATLLTIAKVILILIAILVLYRMLKPVAGGWIP
jgi:hypothetical protein